jgi:hypothetical protein
MVELKRCPLDARFDGLYSNFCRCCQVRLLAAMPKDKRRREYERIEHENGKEALATVIAQVKAEYLRGVEQGVITERKK